MAARKKTSVAKKEEVSAVDKLYGHLRASYPGKVFKGRDYTMPWALRRLPTGLADLDIALGGGLPAGGLSMFVAKEGAGKNWLANHVIAEAQRAYGDECNIGIINTEMIYDKDFGQKCGVSVAMSDEEVAAHSELMMRNEHGHLLTDEYLEKLQYQVGEVMVVMPDKAEVLFDIALEMISSRLFHVILIDSFGSLLTENDEDKSLQDTVRVGGAAGLNTRLMTKLNKAMGYNDDGEPNMTCVIGLNQVRDNIGAQMNQKQTKEGGGWALKHGRWVCIELTRIGAVKAEVKVPGKKAKVKVNVGKQVKWEITKQKAGGHEGHKGEYAFIWKHTGIMYGEHLIKVAEQYGITTRKGAWWNYGEVSLGQGLFNAGQLLDEDAELYAEIEEKLHKASGIYPNHGK